MMKKSNKKEKRMILLLSLLLLLSTISGGFLYWKSLNFNSDYEAKVDAITEIDYSQRQEAINQVVEDGMINIQYSIGATFNGKTSESFNVKNSVNNHYPLIFELFDEHGNSLYKSKQIEPGYEMNTIELNRELSKGTHQCKIKIGYATSGNVSSLFPITLEVK